ncbi:MAG TPA: hypothetical protein VFI72_08985 [Candidatus Angelobacter sp.]|nr:hypothetical protein [Candidatus Angelobacter sp.]
MNRWICTLFSAFTICCCVAAQNQSGTKRFDRGAWSGAATALLTPSPGDWTSSSTQTIPSPDKQKIIHVKDHNVLFETRQREFPTDFGYKTNAELGWAPDSSRFFLTWTTGGELGVWKTEVYQVSETGLTELKGIGQNAIRDFDHQIRQLPPPKDFAKEPGLSYWLGLHYCEPNLVGSQWLNGSKELLVSVLVPNTSYCRYMSEFNVYRIAVPSGQILQRYTAQEAHRTFRRENLPIIVR